MSGGPLRGAGLGVRRGLLPSLASVTADDLELLELTPDNWIGTGGPSLAELAALTERFPCFAHGLSLSLGGPDPLDVQFIAQLRDFLDRYRVQCFSEHLSYCSADGHLYDLMPLPFTEMAVRHVAARIREVQDRLGRRIAVENISYYAAPFRELDELAFVTAVLAEADCDLLLDVNNVYVNSINHSYDARAFIRGLPRDRIAYLHVAGHHVESEDLRIDTHGDAVCDAVWDLLAYTYAVVGNKPTIVERDFNYPPLADLLGEVQRVRELQAREAVADVA